MAHFKVVQVIQFVPLPDWMFQRLGDAGVELTETLCWNKGDLARYASDADVVWTDGTRRLLEGENLAVLEKCGAILRPGSGTDDVDVKAATDLGIIVANTPHVAVEPVADHTISLLFSLVREITRHDRLIRRGQWDCWLAMPASHRYRGATLGLVGFGRIPQVVVRKVSGFEMCCLACDPYVPPERMAACDVESVSLDELLQRADYVLLHCPLTEETHHLIGERELQLMKPKALLVNTARGGVVDETALTRALQEGWIAGAALDVLEKAPPDPDNPLLTMEHVIFTPHIAGLNDAYPDNFCEAAVETILDLAEGRWPRSVVNPEVVPRWGTLASPRSD